MGTQPDEPRTIAFEKLVELIAGLGITAEPKHIRSILISANKVEVVRFRLNDNGRHYFAGDDMATETIVIGIELPVRPNADEDRA